MNYHHLYIFWTLTKEGSFSRAAKSLGISQSAVTSQVKALEGFLGIALVDRSNRRLPRITEKGEHVAQQAFDIFEKGQAILEWSQSGQAQALSSIGIGAISGLSRNFLYEFLKPLLSASNCRVKITTGDQKKLLRQLETRQLDLILSSHNVSLDGPNNYHSQLVQKSDLVFAIKTSALRQKKKLESYIRDYPLVLPSRSSDIRPEIDTFLNGLDVEARVVAEIDDIALLRLYALRSGCLVVLPKMGILGETRATGLGVVGIAAGVEQRFFAITRDKTIKKKQLQSLINTMK